MVATIPKPKKINVLNKWLRENTCNKIAKDNGIDAGTVTSIHQEARINNIPDVDLMRDLALMLKKKVLL